VDPLIRQNGLLQTLVSTDEKGTNDVHMPHKNNKVLAWTLSTARFLLTGMILVQKN
jgi:hypothetical protein